MKTGIEWMKAYSCKSIGYTYFDNGTHAHHYFAVWFGQWVWTTKKG